MKNISIIRTEAIPFVLHLSALFALTLGADLVLHRKDILWVGRYWGYLGTLLIILSFTYSLRKRKIIRFGRPGHYLIAHEYLGWFGALMVLVHGGIHFNGLLAWLAMGAMIITVSSGLVGRFLLKRSQKVLKANKQAYSKSGMTPKEIENKLYWDTLTVKAMKKWRAIHFPITASFITLALLHIAAEIFFWDWGK